MYSYNIQNNFKKSSKKFILEKIFLVEMLKRDLYEFVLNRLEKVEERVR